MLPTAYRTDIATAVKFFRPVLSALYIRNKDKQGIVYLASFDNLEFLNLDNWVIRVLVADLKQAGGMFFYREENGYVHCYIVINNSLYSGNMEIVKVVGVHEFCHFMATVYSITATSIEKQREFLLARLQEKIDELSKDSLNRFFRALASGNLLKDTSELEDEHYRLGCEGNTVNYVVLFKHLMFSKELFEEHFIDSDRKRIKELMNSKQEEQAAILFSKKIEEIAKEKAVPYNLAISQGRTWAKDYLI